MDNRNRVSARHERRAQIFRKYSESFMSEHLKITPKGNLIGKLIAQAGYKSQEAFAIKAGISAPILRAALKSRPTTPKTIKQILDELLLKIPGIKYNDLVESALPVQAPTVQLTPHLQIDIYQPDDPRIAAIVRRMADLAEQIGDPSVVALRFASIFITLEMDRRDAHLFLTAFDDRKFDIVNCDEILTDSRSIRSIAEGLIPTILILPIFFVVNFYKLLVLSSDTLACWVLGRAYPHTDITKRDNDYVFSRKSVGAEKQPKSLSETPPKPVDQSPSKMPIQH
jgi:hypothetical protein